MIQPVVGEMLDGITSLQQPSYKFKEYASQRPDVIFLGLLEVQLAPWRLIFSGSGV